MNKKYAIGFSVGSQESKDIVPILSSLIETHIRDHYGPLENSYQPFFDSPKPLNANYKCLIMIIKKLVKNPITICLTSIIPDQIFEVRTMPKVGTRDIYKNNIKGNALLVIMNAEETDAQTIYDKLQGSGIGKYITDLSFN